MFRVQSIVVPPVQISDVGDATRLRFNREMTSRSMTVKGDFNLGRDSTRVLRSTQHSHNGGSTMNKQRGSLVSRRTRIASYNNNNTRYGYRTPELNRKEGTAAIRQPWE